MQFKIVPDPPESLEFVREARLAVPLVPGSEEDCCTRLLARTHIEARDEAREWLTFLRALGLVEVGERGFHRTDRDPGRAALADAFPDRVFLAEDVLAALREIGGPREGPGGGSEDAPGERGDGPAERGDGPGEQGDGPAERGDGPAEGALDPTAMFDRVRHRIPRWERTRHADWEDVWTERVGRILEWAVLLSLAERSDGGYRAARQGRS